MNACPLVKEKLRTDSPPGAKNAGPPCEPAPMRLPSTSMTALPPRCSRPVLAVMLAFAALAASATAWSQEPPRDRGGSEDRERGRVEGPPNRNRDALSDSVRRFERSNRGSRVLSAERMQADGRDVNRIKAMDDRGRVRIYVDDPQRRAPTPQPRRPTRDDHD
jgi:hypothetical protein